MSVRRGLGCVAGVLLLAGCSGPKVGADFAPGTDWKRYRTYAWSEDPGHVPADPRVNPEALRTRIVSSVDAVLPGRGLAPAPAGTPADLLVRYHASLERRVTYDTITSGYRRDWPTSTTYAREFDVGTLVVDLVSPDKQLVWRGYAQGELDLDASNEERDARTRSAVEKILAQYPPGAEKK